MAEYEFAHVSKAEKIKILAAKLVLGLFIAYECYLLAIGADDLSSRLAALGSIGIFTFAYINVMQVKSEFIQLFEPPYFKHGLEFMVAGVLLKVGSWVV